MILAKFFQKNAERIYKETLKKKEEIKVLELGTGTGILGIFLGCLGWNVKATDVPPVVKGATNPNLEENLGTIEHFGGKVETLDLDW